MKLARHPDYNAGRITFSYLGDIWMANEDGSAVRRITDNRAREVYPRFSPDGRMIAFSSNRYGNNDVFVVPVEGGAPRRLTSPDSGVWTVSGENMENYGVPPDVYVDNTPGDFLKGRDAQIEKAVEVLKEQLAGRKTTTQQQ